MGWGGSGWLCPGFYHEGPQQTNNQTRPRLPPARLITSLIDYFGCSLYENPYGSLAGACCLHGGAVYSNLVPMSRRADPMCYFVCVVMTESGCQALKGKYRGQGKLLRNG